MITKPVTKPMVNAFFFLCTVMMLTSGCNVQWKIPEGLDAVGGTDGSVWERVNQPGFGNENNSSVVAMAGYQGQLYVMTRNEVDGVEVWRTADSGWEQVIFPEGDTNGIYGNTWLNNLWGGMSLFRGKLYCGFSSGLQGSVLKSTGCEIWRYDGANWEPVISDKKDTEESGSIGMIAGCLADDGDITAQFTDTTKSWADDEWAGGILQITSGDGRYRRFDIISNTSDTLTVQQNEVAGNVGSEYTICGVQHYSNSFPPYAYELGEIQAGDSYEIGTGEDENGFGDYWNKTITKMYLFNNGLYVSTGLNYEYGAQVWYTEDGDDWTVIEPANSFGNYHVDPGYPNGQKPVSTSIGSLAVSSVSGSEVLYAGGAGASGSAGMCSRMAKLTPSGWELIVDAQVDENDTGTNENGFGDGMGCTLQTGNFLPWDLVSFGNKLVAGIQSRGGARVLYTLNGSSEDGSWFYSVGGDGMLPAGFDGVVNGGIPTIYQNVAVNLSPFGDYLYAGLVATYAPDTGATEEYLTGSHIWKSSDGISWQQVTVNGFGDDYVVGFEAFTTFAGELYVSASKGASSSTESLGGASILRLTSDPSDDYDKDRIGNSTDNCPEIPNGPDGGTCSKGTHAGNPCTIGGENTSECGDDGFCNMDQEDTDGDGWGDVCDSFPESYPPMQEALDALVSDSEVTVRKVQVPEWEEDANYYYVFEPKNVNPTVGFIFYPGGLVDPRSYAPPVRTIAAEGYLTFIVKMPDDIAPLGTRRANTIIDNEEYAGIEKWIIGGHSVGGSFACAYAKEFTDKLAGVILWASFPSVGFRLDDTELKAISIYGTNDAHPDSIEAGAEHLPADAEFVKIEGGNHTQFGYYDTSPLPYQAGDNPADITREVQQEIIILWTVDFLSLFTNFKSSGCESTSAFTTGEKTVLSDDIERVYYLKLPETYNANDSSYPLIFAFHGLTGDYTNWTEGYYDLQDVVGDEVILVYPNALLKNDLSQWDYDTDPYFFDDLYAELEENLCFDRRKVFAVGHSNGAGMTHTLGCQRGNVLRAIAPVAGSLLDYKACVGQVAVIQTHGSNDTIMPVGQTAPSRDYWIAINSCNKGEPEEGMDPACDAYRGCDADFPVQYCEHSEGHDWPVFASDVIWNFFKSLPPAVPSAKPSDVDIGNLGKGTISFKVLYPADFVGTPYKVALALYPHDSTQPFAGSPLYILDLDIPLGEYTFGEVTEYDTVEISLMGVEYGDYALTVIVFVEGSSHPMPGDGIDYIGVQNFTLDSDTLEATTPFELELVEW